MSEQVENSPAASDTVEPASALRWYVVHAYSGMEKAVERNLRERIDRSGMGRSSAASSCPPKRWSSSRAARSR